MIKLRDCYKFDRAVVLIILDSISNLGNEVLWAGSGLDSRVTVSYSGTRWTENFRVWEKVILMVVWRYHPHVIIKPREYYELLFPLFSGCFSSESIDFAMNVLYAIILKLINFVYT